MIKLLITDIDGTLANDAWRSNVPDFDERQRAAIDDDANLVMMHMLAGLARSRWLVICLTSRNERWRQVTNKWLAKYEVACSQVHMRDDEDFAPAPEFKVQAVKKLLAQVTPTWMMLVDSRADVVAAYRNAGWSALCTM
jgi:hypothetical protein